LLQRTYPQSTQLIEKFRLIYSITSHRCLFHSLSLFFVRIIVRQSLNCPVFRKFPEALANWIMHLLDKLNSFRTFLQGRTDEFACCEVSLKYFLRYFSHRIDSLHLWISHVDGGCLNLKAAFPNSWLALAQLFFI
jgi:hypothetical protein